LAKEIPAAGPGTGRARIFSGRASHTRLPILPTKGPTGTASRIDARWVDLGGAPDRASGAICGKDDAVIGLILIYRQGRSARSRTSRSRSCKTSRRRQVIAMEKTRASLPRRARPWNSRPRPPRSWASSIPRPASLSRCSMPCSKRQCGCAVHFFGELRTYGRARPSTPAATPRSSGGLCRIPARINPPCARARYGTGAHPGRPIG